MPQDTYADILGLVALALADEVGVVVPCHSPDKFRQRIERGLQQLETRPPISVLVRTTPLPQVILIKTEFMTGKQIDVEKAAARIKSRQGTPQSPPDDLP